ncbi:diacylglycerol kinase family protein [Aurantiacibacter spongiae]|uniref:Diacylglycerol kinase n=1 Tax=Aurantiacibacter spongiae TaxID=2488860 RepID=A0A3N5CSC7_9SPHN|nr:diacylglycerol kinase family protein [Aurantiacibacter spongiae]RPF71487.1 diacylglycerol kinase [Aurantiacibacter spongiae]
MHGTIHLFERLPQMDAKPVAANDVPLFPVRARPLVGMIRNSRSHRNENGLEPSTLRDDVIVAMPERRKELAGILADFASKRVDYIAIDGGDGTVRDVLTCGAGVFAGNWPRLIILPNGKTNALAHDLRLPSGWTLDEALQAARRGRAAFRRPLVVTQRENERAQVRGFVLGAGAFTRAIALGQRSHDLGAFNNAVVGLTTAWSVAQAFFGSNENAWRRGTPMRLRDSEGADLPHRGGLPAGERWMVFASTLERFPAGLAPFRGIEEPLRLAVMDNVRRSLLLRLGAILRGNASERTRERGFHAYGAETVDFDIENNFILDGEAFPPGEYRLSAGPRLRFVVP